VNEARRTLRCWLLAAFLERGCDPTTARTPAVLPREKVLDATELAVLRAAGAAAGKVRFLAHYRARRRQAAGAGA
jgi:uncharacterized membrane protein